MSYPDHLNPIERQIIDKLIKAALADGFKISVYGDGILDLAPSADYEAIINEVAACGETCLMLWPGGHWIQLVHGNGAEVISDYTVKTEEFMEPICDFAEGLQ